MTTRAPRSSSAPGPPRSTRTWTCRTPPASSSRRSPRTDQSMRVQITRALSAGGPGLGSDNEIAYGGSTPTAPWRNRATRSGGMRRVRGPTPTVSTSPEGSGVTSTLCTPGTRGRRSTRGPRRVSGERTRAGNGGDAAYRPATRRRYHHAHERREPDERVPLGPGAVRLPQPETGEPRKHGPRAGGWEGPWHAPRLLGAAHQRRGQEHERHAGGCHRDLPRAPQPEAHAAGGRRDATTEGAHQVRCRQDEDRRRARRPPAS